MSNHESRERAKVFVEQAIDEAQRNALYEAAKICADCYTNGEGADVAEGRILERFVEVQRCQAKPPETSDDR